jgi:hypothetical protein
LSLRRRHQRGDRLRFNGYERERDLGDFQFDANRRTNDLHGGRWFKIVGKGALDCSKPPVTIGVMFLGGSTR